MDGAASSCTGRSTPSPGARPWRKRPGYKHFMQKEIFEQPRALIDTFRSRINQEEGEVVLEEVPFSREACRPQEVVIVACGTSFHAAMVGKPSSKACAACRWKSTWAPSFATGTPCWTRRAC